MNSQTSMTDSITLEDLDYWSVVRKFLKDLGIDDIDYQED